MATRSKKTKGDVLLPEIKPQPLPNIPDLKPGDATKPPYPDAEIPPQPKPIYETKSAGAEPENDAKTDGDKEPTFTKSQVEAMIAQAIRQATQGNRTVQEDNMVTMLYLAEVSKEDTLVLPGFGTLRPHSYLQVTKKEFGSKFMTALARKLIDRRYLLVISGLTNDERERWNCLYRPGEIMSENVFDKMLALPTEEICDIFRRLCPEHRQFIVTRFITAAERKDNRVSLEKALALNEISKADGEELFRPIIEAYKAQM